MKFKNRYDHPHERWVEPVGNHDQSGQHETNKSFRVIRLGIAAILAEWRQPTGLKSALRNRSKSSLVL